MTPRPLLRRLAGDTRGTAAIEYALWSSFFFMTMLGAADFGLWRTYQLRLSSAVQEAAMIAAQNPGALAPAALKTFVQTAAALPGAAPTVAIGCNMARQNVTAATNNCVNAGRAYVCLNGAVTPATYAAATGMGVACTAPVNTRAGYYMTIQATYPFQPLVLPRRWLSGRPITDATTVRIE